MTGKMKKHYASTAYIVASIEGLAKVLLHQHKKHKIWLGIGGHVESDENPVETVVREVKEETILTIDLVSPSLHKPIKTDEVYEIIQPFMLLEEKIPPHKGEPAHYHVDCIYLAITTKPHQIQMNETFNWFSLDEINKLTLTKEVAYIAKQAILYCSKLL